MYFVLSIVFLRYTDVVAYVNCVLKVNVNEIFPDQEDVKADYKVVFSLTLLCCTVIKVWLVRGRWTCASAVPESRHRKEYILQQSTELSFTVNR